jgi:hypothetical protein
MMNHQDHDRLKSGVLFEAKQLGVEVNWRNRINPGDDGREHRVVLFIKAD